MQYNSIIFNKIKKTTRKNINVFLAGQSSYFNEIKVSINHSDYLIENNKKILFLRQPIDWIYANWSLDQTSLDLVSYANNNKLLNYQSLNSARPLTNIHTLEGLDIKEETLGILDQYYFIGLFDYFYESLDLISFLFGWPLYTSSRIFDNSISRKNIEHLSLEDFIYLQDNSDIDDFFYKQAHQRFLSLWQRYIKLINFDGDMQQYWSYRSKHKDIINKTIVHYIAPYSINIASKITIYGKFMSEHDNIILGQDEHFNSLYFKTKLKQQHTLKIYYHHMSKSSCMVKVNNQKIKSNINHDLKCINIPLPANNAYDVELVIDNDMIVLNHQNKEIKASVIISSIILLPH